MTPDVTLALSMLCWDDVRHSPFLHGVLVLAGTGTTALFLLGVAAYYRRRSTTYLLITLALGALVVRTIVGTGTVLGIVPMGLHHLVEHGLDVVIAALLLCAIYANGSSLEQPADGDRHGRR